RVATSSGMLETGLLLAASRCGRTVRTPADVYQVPEVHRGIHVCDSRFVAAAHASGSQVHVWTVNEEKSIVRLLELGVDGIVTDRPDVALQALGRS
ncbi:MAG: glycerophosphodiester phosphodiesterase family protein, partial [Paracoccaceae bacterium]